MPPSRHLVSEYDEDGLCLFDSASGLVTHTNDAYRRLSGRSNTIDSSEHWGGWIAREHLQEYAKLSKAVAEGRTQSVSFLHRRRGDRACSAEVIVNRLSPGSGYMARVKLRPSSPHLPLQPSPTVAPAPAPGPTTQTQHPLRPHRPLSDTLIISSVTHLFSCSTQPACLLAAPATALNRTHIANSPLATTAAAPAAACNNNASPVAAATAAGFSNTSSSNSSGGGIDTGAYSLSSPFNWSAYAVLTAPEEYGGTALSAMVNNLPSSPAAAAGPAAALPSYPPLELVYQNAALCNLVGYSDQELLREGGLARVLGPSPQAVTTAVAGERGAATTMVAHGTPSAVPSDTTAAAAALPAVGGMEALAAAASAAAAGITSAATCVDLDCYDRSGRRLRCTLSISLVGSPAVAAADAAGAAMAVEAEAARGQAPGWRHAGEGPYVKRNAVTSTGPCGCGRCGGGNGRRQRDYRDVYRAGSSDSNSSDRGSGSGCDSGSGSGSNWSTAERGLGMMNGCGGSTSDAWSDGAAGCSVGSGSGSFVASTRTTDRRPSDNTAVVCRSSALVFPGAELNEMKPHHLLQQEGQRQQEQQHKVLRPLQEGAMLSITSQQQKQKQLTKEQQQQQQHARWNYPCGARYQAASEPAGQTDCLFAKSTLQQKQQQNKQQQHKLADTQEHVLQYHHQQEEQQERSRPYHQQQQRVLSQAEARQQQQQYFLVIFRTSHTVDTTHPLDQSPPQSTPQLPASTHSLQLPSTPPHTSSPETAAPLCSIWKTPPATSFPPPGSTPTASSAATGANACCTADDGSKPSATAAAVVSSRGGACASCRLYAAALDCVREGITITDPSAPDHPIVYTNQAFLDMTGYGRHEVLGRNCRFLQGPDTDTGAVRTIREALSNRRGVTVTLANYTKTGTRFWNELRLQPVAVSEAGPSVAAPPATGTVATATGGGRNPTGRHVSYIGVQHDVSELLARKASEARLRSAKEAAESATEAKSQFLANISHEIRTPLNGMIATAQLMLGSSLTPEQRELTETILDSGSALVGVLGDILDFSRIDHGSLELQARPVCLRQTTEACIELVAAEALKKGLAVAYLVDDAVLAAPLLGDPIRIRQVLANLLSNAVKFTERGEVVVHVTLERRTNCRNPAAIVEGYTDDADTNTANRLSSCTSKCCTCTTASTTATLDASGGAAVGKSSNQPPLTAPPDGDGEGDVNVVHFAVSDTGIGIDDESASKLFQHFRQGSEAMSRRYGGIGLGLAISKRLAQLMHGDVWVDSRRGAGSTFHFTLRAEWAAQGPGGDAWPPCSPARSTVTTPSNSIDCTPRTSTDEGPASGPAAIGGTGVAAAAVWAPEASAASTAASTSAATVVNVSSLYSSSAPQSQQPLRLSSGSAGSGRGGGGRELRTSPWLPDGTAGTAPTPAMMAAVASSSLYAPSSSVEPTTQPHRLSNSSNVSGHGGGREMRTSPWLPDGTAKEAVGVVAAAVSGGGGDVSTVGVSDSDSGAWATQAQPPPAQATSTASNTTCAPSCGSSGGVANDGPEERAALFGRTVLIDVSHGATSTQVWNSCRQLGIRAVQADACTAPSPPPTSPAPATATEAPSLAGSPTRAHVGSDIVPAAAAAGPSSPHIAVTPQPPPVHDVLVVSTDRLMTALKAGWKGRPVVALGDRELLPPAVQPLVVALAVPVRHSRLATALVKATALLRWNGSSAPRLANTPIPCESIQTLKSWRLKRGLDWESFNRRTSLDNSALERNNVTGRTAPAAAAAAVAGVGARSVGAASCAAAAAAWTGPGGSIICNFVKNVQGRLVSPARQQQVPIPEHAELSAVPGDAPADQQPQPHHPPPSLSMTTLPRDPYEQQTPPPAHLPCGPSQPQWHCPVPCSPGVVNTSTAHGANGGCEAVGAGVATAGGCGVQTLQALQPLRILIAEDNKVNQKVVLKVLQQILRGCQPPDVVENGLQVLAALQKKTYDLILMDIHMPEMDGLEASRRIQETYLPEDRPRIIALSADTVQTLHDRCREAGIEAFLVKPFRIEELARVMRTYCGPRHLGGPTRKHLETDTAACGMPLAV